MFLLIGVLAGILAGLFRIGEGLLSFRPLSF
jgi:hypothetical protein